MSTKKEEKRIKAKRTLIKRNLKKGRQIFPKAKKADISVDEEKGSVTCDGVTVQLAEQPPCHKKGSIELNLFDVFLGLSKVYRDALSEVFRSDRNFIKNVLLQEKEGLVSLFTCDTARMTKWCPSPEEKHHDTGLKNKIIMIPPHVLDAVDALLAITDGRTVHVTVQGDTLHIEEEYMWVLSFKYVTAPQFSPAYKYDQLLEPSTDRLEEYEYTKCPLDNVYCRGALKAFSMANCTKVVFSDVGGMSGFGGGCLDDFSRSVPEYSVIPNEHGFAWDSAVFKEKVPKPSHAPQLMYNPSLLLDFIDLPYTRYSTEIEFIPRGGGDVSDSEYDTMCVRGMVGRGTYETLVMPLRT